MMRPLRSHFPLWCALAMSACAPNVRDVDTHGAIPTEERAARDTPAERDTPDPLALAAEAAADASAVVRAGAERYAAELPRPVDLSTLEHLEPLNARSVVMKRACDLGDRLTIAAVGDVLLHTALQRQAVKEKDDERFRTLWSNVEDLFARADLTYANLEGPAAKGVLVGGEKVKDPGHVFDDAVYTSYPRFNYHPTLAEDLKKSGVDVVSTVNNHSLDRGPIGVDRTIEALDQAGLPYFGTRKQEHRDEDVRDAWYVITETKGWRLAWVGCTFSTNGVADPYDQVLECYAEQEAVLKLVEELAARDDIDAVIATPHWGREYTQKLRDRQVELGEALLEAGAVAVIAGHPHVVQEWTTHTTSDGREGFILYSLGNFVSYMDTTEERAAIMLYLGLTRPYDGGEVFVNGVRHVPLWMVQTKKRNHVADLDRLGEEPEDAWDHILERFGSYNLYRASEPMTTTPQCDASWTPPVEWHPHNGWSGGGCTEAAGCGGLDDVSCDASAPQGFCALACDGSCPQRRGGPRTACVVGGEEEDVPARCHVTCFKDSQCRPGYRCARRMLVSKAPKKHRKAAQKVCVPR